MIRRRRNPARKVRRGRPDLPARRVRKAIRDSGASVGRKAKWGRAAIRDRPAPPPK